MVLDFTRPAERLNVGALKPRGARAPWGPPTLTMNRFRIWLLAVAIALPIGLPSEAHARRNDQPRIHKVYKGQTLGMIAKRYNVSVEAITFANRIRKRNRIKPGLKLIIPAIGDKKGTKARALRDGGYLKNPKVRKRVQNARKTKKKAAKTTTPAARKHKRGYVTLVGYNARWKGYVIAKGGKLTDSSRKGFEKVLVSRRTGKRARIHPRLIRLIARVSDHYGGATIHVVSGFRPKSTNRWSSHSRHNVGRAIDFRVTGVKNSTLRNYLKKLGGVGVGYYPNSGFVHLDVRKTSSYWVDYSGPGQRPRYALPDGSDPAKRRRPEPPRAEPPKPPAPEPPPPEASAPKEPSKS